MLLDVLPERAVVVALEETGTVLTSEAFATQLGNWRDDGVGALAFLIGGVEGHGEAARVRADLVLSLGAMDLAPSACPSSACRTTLSGRFDPRGPPPITGHDAPISTTFKPFRFSVQFVISPP